MKNIILLIGLLCSNSIMLFGESDLASELYRLDKLLERQDVYRAEKELRIDSLHFLLRKSANKIERVSYLDMQIGKEYQFFRSDSAIAYFSRSLEAARRCENAAWLNESKMYLIISLSVSGIFKESSEIEGNINRSALPDSLLSLWYYTKQQMNHYASLYTNSTSFAKRYGEQEQIYRDSLWRSLPANSLEALYCEAIDEQTNKNYDKAQNILLRILKIAPENTHMYGQAASLIAGILKRERRNDEYPKFLITAAVSDIKTVIKENSALYKLAIYLYKQGDYKRAYKYIKYSLEDAVVCNANMRAIRISHVLPVIDTAYRYEEQQQKKMLFIFVIVASALSFCLIIFIFLLGKQMKKLSVTKKKLEQANLIKEEYIRHFLELCSVYIGKLYSFRRTVSRKIRVGQTEELLRMTKDSDVTEIEQKEFFTNFDLAFLHLFPNFVQDFNKLLYQEGRFILKADELLNTELRIFALIRLGINDSTKIANFLHYSLNTIYTYRNKVKCKAVDREHFEINLMKIN